MRPPVPLPGLPARRARCGRLRRWFAVWLLALAGLAMPARSEIDPQPWDSTAEAPRAEAADDVLRTEAPATVVVWGREIATFRAAYGGQSPAERAAAVSKRIEHALGDNPRAPLRLQHVEDGDLRGILVVAGSSGVLFGLVATDVAVDAPGALEREAAATLERVRELGDAMARQRQPALLARSAAESLAMLTVVGFVLWLLERRLRPRLHRRQRVFIEALEATDRREAGAAGLGFGEVAAIAVRAALRIGLTAAELVVAFLGVEFVLRRFPYTQALGDRLARRLLEFVGGATAAVADQLPNLFVVAVVAFFARAVWHLVRSWTTAVERGVIEVEWLDADAARPTRILFGIGITMTAIVVAYPFVPGSGSEAFKGASVLVGLMVSLGGSSVIGQLIAGLVVLYSRAIRRGDYVKIDEYEGRVRELGLLATRLVTAHGEQINIPSAVMVTAVSRNATALARPGGAVLHTALTIGYDAPWRQVHGLLLAAAARTPGVLAEPAPRVFQRALSDFFVEYELSLQVERDRPLAELRSRLHAEIQDAFNAAGVQIMSPHYESQPEASVVVPPERWSPPGAVSTPPGSSPPASPDSGRDR